MDGTKCESVHKLIVLGVVLLVLLEGSSCGSDQTCRAYGDCGKMFRENGWIPKFAKGMKYDDLEVRFHGKQIECGDSVSLLQALTAPTVKYDLTDKCVNVTILAFAPDSLLFAPFVNWLFHNIPAAAVKSGFNNGGNILDFVKGKDQSVGDVKASYIFPEDPTGGSGLRNSSVVYFIYCQCRYVADLRPLIRTDRVKFDIKGYMKKNGMGCPVAGFYHVYYATGKALPTLVKVWPNQSGNLPISLPGTNLPVQPANSNLPAPDIP